jgi:DNA-binding FadR family transcriptional regulator
MTASLDDSAAFVRADMRFHLAVARASKNDVLMQTYHLIRSLLEEVVRQADELPGGKERALANHNQILAGIKQHDPQHAMAASERQITDALAYRNPSQRH